MKLWDKGFSTEKLIEQFTVGKDYELDENIAKYDVLASMAHASMLEKINILTKTELDAILEVFKEILQEIEDGKFTIEADFEDVHSKLEYLLTERLGETGKKIHTGRSRNDQVLVAMHLYIKDEIKDIVGQTESLFKVLTKLSEQYKDNIIPGYTHMQIAMPSSFGLWFGAYAESLVDDLYFLQAAYRIADQNPLGSAAGYGSSFPIDRTFTTRQLGFEDLKYNVVAAQMSRGKVEKSMAVGMASIAATVGKLAMDICLYMGQNYGFLSFPDQLTTGSSIMPHKKNPDVFELVRGKCNKIQMLPTELGYITNNLSSGYHRDLQLLKESLIPAIETLKSCLHITTFALDQIIIKEGFINEDRYKYLYSVEAVNEKVVNGLSFRDAYVEVAEEIANDRYQPQKHLNHTHEGSIGNLCTGQIQEKFNKAIAFFKGS
ncbi:argininosuccinate lyase [Fulvivirgaceae bacterium BMA12]|uniref:Argininosuccinate lyase n=1 Tax=Agaribacillus aureus TaxID=3051825 RepID=A0ABT8LC18_9BACT|nr:argininosuccinate lyase [Fulvivirgaceae bacterium BMA12]